MEPLWYGLTLCLGSECKAETWSWLLHNLYLELSRQAQAGCAGNSPSVVSRVSLSVELLSHATSANPGNTLAAERLSEIYSALDSNSAPAAVDDQGPAEEAYSLGVALHDQKRFQEARDAFSRVLKEVSPRFGGGRRRTSERLCPENSEAGSGLCSRALGNLVFLSAYIADWRREKEHLEFLARELEMWLLRAEQLEALNQLPESIPPVHPWQSLSMPMLQSMRLRLAHSFWRFMHAHAVAKGGLPEKPLAGRRGCAASAAADRRLRVGFVSADFKQKATAYLAVSVFEALRNTTLDTFVYAVTPDENGYASPWRKRIAAAAHHFRSLEGVEPAEASKQLISDNLDVLVDLDGYSNEGLRVTELFARRHAPVTVAWFVYIGTLGNPEVDYLVTDHVTTPQDEATFQTGMSGARIFMPHTFFPNSHRDLFPVGKKGDLRGIPSGSEAKQALRAEMGLPRDGFVFASFNKHLKIRPAMFQAWCAVLKAVPHSVLWLLRFPAESQPQITKAFASAGLAPERLVLGNFVLTAEENFFRLAVGADLVLDTSIYGAHTGTVDSLWGGVPLLTCVGDCGEAPGHGDSMASRVAASMLTALGLNDTLVTTSLEAYERAAVDLATQPKRYSKVRSRLLRTRKRAPMWDPAAYAKGFADGLRRAYEARVGVGEGQPIPDVYASAD